MKAYAAPTAALLKEYLAALAAGDDAALKKLDAAGEVAVIDAGTRCTVVEAAGEFVKVSVEGGALAGINLFVQAGQLVRK